MKTIVYIFQQNLLKQWCQVVKSCPWGKSKASVPNTDLGYSRMSGKVRGLVQQQWTWRTFWMLSRSPTERFGVVSIPDHPQEPDWRRGGISPNRTRVRRALRICLSQKQRWRASCLRVRPCGCEGAMPWLAVHLINKEAGSNISRRPQNQSLGDGDPCPWLLGPLLW